MSVKHFLAMGLLLVAAGVVGLLGGTWGGVLIGGGIVWIILA